MSIDATERTVPDQPWQRIGLVVLVLIVVATAGWEIHWRSNGFSPGEFVDTPGLWAIQRRAASDRDQPTVVIGSSRVLFDINLDVWERVAGSRPIQLALPGTGPRPFLHDLAEDTTFVGVVLVGVTPPLFFTDAFNLRLEALSHYKTETPSQYLSQKLAMLLEARLAFLDSENTPFFSLLKFYTLENREGVARTDRTPRRLETVDADRNSRMWHVVERDSLYKQLSRDIWVHLIEGAPKPPPDAPPLDPTPVLKSVKEDVDKIRSRGGDVVFIRAPSEALWRDAENGGFPREQFWDLLLEYTNTGGVHFEDNEALQGLDLPEWSHLSASDAVRYTEALVPLVHEALETRSAVKDLAKRVPS
jgi:hypothetical protein